MSPKLVTLKGVITGKDMDERARVDTGGGVEPRQGGDPQCGVGRDVAGRELSPGEAVGASISGGRRQRIEASKCRAAVESRARGGGARASAGARPEEVQRAGGRAVWADVGRRAFVERRRRDGASRHVAAVDAGGGVVESRAQTIAASPAPGAEGAFRRAGAARWQFSPVVRGSRRAWLPDELGR